MCGFVGCGGGCWKVAGGHNGNEGGGGLVTAGGDACSGVSNRGLSKSEEASTTMPPRCALRAGARRPHDSPVYGLPPARLFRGAPGGGRCTAVGLCACGAVPHLPASGWLPGGFPATGGWRLPPHSSRTARSSATQSPPASACCCLPPLPPWPLPQLAPPSVPPAAFTTLPPPPTHPHTVAATPDRPSSPGRGARAGSLQLPLLHRRLPGLPGCMDPGHHRAVSVWWRWWLGAGGLGFDKGRSALAVVLGGRVRRGRRVAGVRSARVCLPEAFVWLTDGRGHLHGWWWVLRGTAPCRRHPRRPPNPAATCRPAA